MSDPKDLTAIRDAESALVFDEQANESGPPYKSKSEMKRVEAREFWLRQYSQDGGMYSDIRVMKPSDCDLGVRPPPGHDNLKYYDEVHVIEKSAFDEVVAELESASKERDSLLAGNETGAKLFFDYWQETLRERDALKFELQSKQRPLSEQVLALTIEKEALKAEVERLKAQDLTHAVLAADVKLREERDALTKECVEFRHRYGRAIVEKTDMFHDLQSMTIERDALKAEFAEVKASNHADGFYGRLAAKNRQEADQLRSACEMLVEALVKIAKQMTAEEYEESEGEELDYTTAAEAYELVVLGARQALAEIGDRK